MLAICSKILFIASTLYFIAKKYYSSMILTLIQSCFKKSNTWVEKYLKLQLMVSSIEELIVLITNEDDGGLLKLVL